MKEEQLLGLWVLLRRQVCRDTGCFCLGSFGPIRVFFQASCSWWSEDLFGQSFSTALLCSGTWGIPCLRSSVWRIRHIEGAPWLESYSEIVRQSLQGASWTGSCSVVQCIRRLIGQPLYCSAADAGVWREGGCGDGFTPCAWLSSITLLPWLPSFPPQAFPTTISSLTSPRSVSPQSTAVLALGLLHNP